jgi:hypothetical protein
MYTDHAHTYHVQVVMEMRSINDDLQREARQQHEQGDILLRNLNVARSRLDSALANAVEIRARADDARKILNEQVSIQIFKCLYLVVCILYVCVCMCIVHVCMYVCRCIDSKFLGAT